MASAKDLVLRPISAAEANATVRRYHYSGKIVNNSQLHIGVFWGGRLEGAMQFGPSLDKRKIMGLVEGTSWNGFMELNRMAFSDRLPRNSESRALSVAMRLLRRYAPHIQWIVSFADGTQSGDGTIYRASGFVLTGIKRNNQIWEMPSAELGQARSLFSRMSLTDGSSKLQQAQARRLSRVSATKSGNILETGGASMRPYIEAGARPLPGFQLRYIYFLDPTARQRLTVQIVPFSEIERHGAGMYRGKPRARAASIVVDAPADQAGEGGAEPTAALHDNEGS